MADYVVDLTDAGSGAGTIKFYTASFGQLMCTITFADPAFAGAVNGAASTVAGALSGTVTLAGTNTMAVFRIEDSDANSVLTGSVGTSGADINLTSTTFNQNDTLTINSLTYTAAP